MLDNRDVFYCWPRSDLQLGWESIPPSKIKAVSVFHKNQILFEGEVDELIICFSATCRLPLNGSPASHLGDSTLIVFKLGSFLNTGSHSVTVLLSSLSTFAESVAASSSCERVGEVSFPRQVSELGVQLQTVFRRISWNVLSERLSIWHDTSPVLWMKGSEEQLAELKRPRSIISGSPSPRGWLLGLMELDVDRMSCFHLHDLDLVAFAGGVLGACDFILRSFSLGSSSLGGSTFLGRRSAFFCRTWPMQFTTGEVGSSRSRSPSLWGCW